MKKRLISIVLTAVMTVTMVFALTGCLGPEKPTAEDATGYVKAVLDLVCTGDYDHSVQFDDIEEGKELELRDEMIKQGFTESLGDAGMSEEVQDGFFNYFISALAKAKYTVGDATPTDDGGFDVTVTTEPMKLFSEIDEELESRIMDNAESIMSMSEEEQNNEVMRIMLEILNGQLDNPQYDAAKETTVHYGLIDEENNEYGLSDEDSEKIFSALFAMEEEETADETAEE